MYPPNILPRKSEAETPDGRVPREGIPYMVVFEEDEIDQGVVNLKNMELRTEVQVNLEDLADKLVSEGCRKIVKNDARLLDLLR